MTGLEKISNYNNDIHAVVAYAGARDNYQLPVALYEGDLLEAFVTDSYYKFSKPIDSLPREIRSIVLKRYCTDLDGSNVIIPVSSFIFMTLGRFGKKQYFAARKDKSLGYHASELALKHGAALFIYSYYAYSAFSAKAESLPFRFIFQVHPHPVEVQRILKEEIDLTPEAASSLNQEYEVGLPQAQFERLAIEPHLANGWVTASSFTANTLAAQGIPREKIHTVPYGVDFSQFSQRTQMPDPKKPLRIIFVGSMVQRKGLSYLLESVRQLNSSQVEVVLCGRGARDEQLLTSYKDLNITIKTNLSRADLVTEIHQADIMVFPSLAEGFAHVILEVMACGVPVIATSHTCAPDIFEDGKNGFIVPIRNPEAIAEKLEWAMTNREPLYEMGLLAADRAGEFTWMRFRSSIREAYQTMLTDAGDTK